MEILTVKFFCFLLFRLGYETVKRQLILKTTMRTKYKRQSLKTSLAVGFGCSKTGKERDSG